MVQRRHFMSAMCIYLTLFSGIARAYADSTDPYPSREILLKAAISICTEVNSQNPVSSLKVSPLIQKLLLKTPDSKNTVYDGTGWTIDTFFHEPPATFLRLLKSNSYFIFDYRQSPQTIESIANITLEKDCQFSGARFTYYNSALRPVRRIKLDSSYQEIQSVVIEEPVKEISPVSPTPKDRVRIGIIDTGIDYNHSSLIEKSRPMLGIDLITKDRPPYDYTNTIQNEEMGKHFSHGTAVADIASRNVDALIIPVRTSNQPNLDGAAVEYLAKKGVHIINISQGTSKKTEWLPLKTAMKKHPEILFIVSAGNESENIDEQPFYPSDFGLSNMLVVTSINKYGQLSEFTNFGPQHVHFAALGENVSAALAGGGEWTVNGSSFAAPVVTNIAAKLLRENPTLTTQKLRSLLIQKAQPTAELKNKVKYGVLGME